MIVRSDKYRHVCLNALATASLPVNEFWNKLLLFSCKHRILVMESRVVLKWQRVGGIVQTQSNKDASMDRKKGEGKKKNSRIGQQGIWRPSLSNIVI